VQGLACWQAQHKLSIESLEKYRTHQKCTDEQKLGSIVVFKADPWRLRYSEAEALTKTASNIVPPIRRRYLNRKEPASPGCPYSLGDRQQKTNFQALQRGCKQLRFSEHF